MAWPIRTSLGRRDDVTDRPNLVIFMPDEMRADTVGHLGNPCGLTPRMDALAAGDAVSFASAFCQNPVCVPSRIAMFTGLYPHVRGHRTMHHLLHADEPQLLERLHQSGYEVWWAGKNDLLVREAMEKSIDVRHQVESNPDAPHVSRQIYPQVWPEVGQPGYWSHYAGRLPEVYEDNDDRRRVEAAVEFLRTRDDDRPFCVLLTLSTPHVPYAVNEPWYSMVDRASVPAPLPRDRPEHGKPVTLARLRERQGLDDWGEAQFRELRATYYGMVARTDALLGVLVDGLVEHGLYDNTTLVVTSDHGDFAGDFGLPEKAQNVLDDSLTRVPLIIKPPAGVAVSAGVSDALVALVDLTATLEDLCGLGREYTHFGRSLVPLLADGNLAHRDGVIAEGGRLAGEDQAKELPSRSDPSGHYYPKLMLQREDDVAHGKAIMYRTRTHKYVHRIAEQDELYDLTTDPHEQHNRVNDPDLAGILGELRLALLDELFRTADTVPTMHDKRTG